MFTTKLPCMILPVFIAAVLFSSMNVQAGFEWSVLKDISLQDKPRDIAISLDGATAYVLCDTSIEIIALKDRRIIGSLPVGAGYSKLAITPGGDELLLTGREKKQISIVQVSQAYDIAQGTSPVLGNTQAPVTLTAFLDYQCPYCSKAYPLLEQTLAKYPSDVKLVIKHYPLKFHGSAKSAAVAALAAARQNKYKELSSLLMQNSIQLSAHSIRQSAQQAGLDMEQFDAAAKDPSIQTQIASDMKEGARCSVRGVPSIYINGRPIKSYTIESFSIMIKDELKKKNS